MINFYTEFGSGILTHHSPVLLIYTPLSFLMFSSGIDKKHGTVMSQKKYFLKIVKDLFKRFIIKVSFIWDKIFKSGPSKICGSPPFKNL